MSAVIEAPLVLQPSIVGPSARGPRRRVRSPRATLVGQNDVRRIGNSNRQRRRTIVTENGARSQAFEVSSSNTTCSPGEQRGVSTKRSSSATMNGDTESNLCRPYGGTMRNTGGPAGGVDEDWVRGLAAVSTDLTDATAPRACAAAVDVLGPTLTAWTISAAATSSVQTHRRTDPWRTRTDRAGSTRAGCESPRVCRRL